MYVRDNFGQGNMQSLTCNSYCFQHTWLRPNECALQKPYIYSYPDLHKINTSDVYIQHTPDKPKFPEWYVGQCNPDDTRSTSTSSGKSEILWRCNSHYVGLCWSMGAIKTYSQSLLGYGGLWWAIKTYSWSWVVYGCLWISLCTLNLDCAGAVAFMEFYYYGSISQYELEMPSCNKFTSGSECCKRSGRIVQSPVRASKKVDGFYLLITSSSTYELNCVMQLKILDSVVFDPGRPRPTKFFDPWPSVWPSVDRISIIRNFPLFFRATWQNHKRDCITWPVLSECIYSWSSSIKIPYRSNICDQTLWKPPMQWK